MLWTWLNYYLITIKITNFDGWVINGKIDKVIEMSFFFAVVEQDVDFFLLFFEDLVLFL